MPEADKEVIRDYREGDEELICALFSRFNDRPMNLPFWRWKFLNSPFGPAIIKLAFSQGELVSHRTAMAVTLCAGELQVKAALMVGTFTHPQWRRRGLFSRLSESIYREAARRGVELTYNFPNPNSYPLYRRIEGWKTVDRRLPWGKSLAGEQPPPVSHTARRLERFGDEIDRLWEAVRPAARLAVPRTSSFLNWRFCDHPRETYSKFLIVDSNGNTDGYCVLKAYEGGTGHIVDMLCRDGNVVIVDLLRIACRSLRSQGLTRVSFWSPGPPFYEPLLEKEGFAAEASETHFGVKVLDQTRLTLAPHDVSAWHLTMADSDVF